MASLSITLAAVALATSANAATSDAHTAKTTVARIPQWFLNDVQIAEHTKLSSGSNYALYEGSDYQFAGTMKTLFGVYSGAGHDIDFGMSLQGLSNGLRTNPRLYGPLTDINVMERIWQVKKPIGEMVPAVSIDVGNTNYLAFANNQIITASSKSGYIRYTVYSVKGITTSTATATTVPVIIDANNGNQKLCEAIKKYLVKVSDPKLFKNFEIVKVSQDNKGPMGHTEWIVTLIVHHQPGIRTAYNEGVNTRIVGLTIKNGSYQVNSLATGG